MQKVWTRKCFLIGLPLLYFLSLVLPALHEGGRFNGSLLGFHALYGAILLLPYCSIDDGPRILIWMSVQSNAFIFLGWLAVAFPSLYLGRRSRPVWIAWGLVSTVLALTPWVWSEEKLLIGYYCWVLAIGLLTVWLWRFDKERQVLIQPESLTDHLHPKTRIAVSQ